MKYEFWTIGDLATAEVLNLNRPTPFVENWNYIESRVSRVLFVDIQNVQNKDFGKWMFEKIWQF